MNDLGSGGFRIKPDQAIQSLLRQLAFQLIEPSNTTIWIWDLNAEHFHFAPGKAILNDAMLLGNKISRHELLSRILAADRARTEHWLSTLHIGDPASALYCRALNQRDQKQGYLAEPLICIGQDGIQRYLLGTLQNLSTFTDTGDHLNRTFQRLRESEARLRELAETSFDAIIIHDRKQILDFNDNALQMYGRDRKQLLNMNPYALLAPQDDGLSKRHAESGAHTHFETWAKRSDGTLFPVEIKARSANLDGIPVRVVAMRDLTEQRANEQALRANEERYRAFIIASSEAIWRADLMPPMPLHLDSKQQRNFIYQQAVIVESNQAMAELHGFERPEDTYGLAIADLYDASFFHNIANQFLRQGYTLSDVETPFRNRKDDFIWIQGSYFGAIENDHLHRIWCIQRDVTERRRHLAELEYQATHDALTGLYNRKWLSATIDSRISSEAEKPFALIFLDLNNFKEINDTLGHDTGDLLLSQIGPCIRPLLQRAELARLGGDEFAILISRFSSEHDVYDLTTTIIEAIREPFVLSGMRLEISASAGISLFPQHGQNSSTLMRCADIAMYLAKKNQVGWELYSPSIDKHSPRRLMLMTDLGAAIRENQLFLVYQPKVELHRSQLTGFEVLLRWQHPKQGQIPPSQFIPLAEMSDMIHPLTDWVLKSALRQLREWYRQGWQTSVAINISTRNLLNSQFPDSLQRLLQHYRIPPEALQLEITESALITDPEQALATLERIRKLGVKLAIDDFGTGYSSLAYLKRLPVDVLKIDIAFISQMLINHVDAMIVRSTISLAHNLDLQVVAEGVEDEATLAALRSIGCDEAQGYYIAKPMPAEQASGHLSQEQQRLR